MNKNIYCLLIIYFSMVFGIAFKFYNKGIRGFYLLRSLMLPFSLFISAILFGISKVKEVKGIRGKFSEIFHWIFFTFSCFPIVVGLYARDLSIKERAIRKNRNNKNISLKSVWNSCFDYCSQNNKRLKLA